MIRRDTYILMQTGTGSEVTGTYSGRHIFDQGRQGYYQTVRDRIR